MKRSRKPSLLDLENAVAASLSSASAGQQRRTKRIPRANALLRLERDIQNLAPKRAPRVRTQSFDHGESLTVAFSSGSVPAELDLTIGPTAFSEQVDPFAFVEDFDEGATVPAPAAPSNPVLEPGTVPTTRPAAPPTTDTSGVNPSAIPATTPDAPVDTTPNEQDTVRNDAPIAAKPEVNAPSLPAPMPSAPRPAGPSAIDQPIDASAIDEDLRKILEASPIPPIEEKPAPVLAKPTPPSDDTPTQQGQSSPGHQIFDEWEKSSRAMANTFDLGNHSVSNALAEIDARVAAEEEAKLGGTRSTMLSRDDMLSDIQSISRMLESQFEQDNAENAQPELKPQAQPIDAKHTIQNHPQPAPDQSPTAKEDNGPANHDIGALSPEPSESAPTTSEPPAADEGNGDAPLPDANPIDTSPESETTPAPVGDRIDFTVTPLRSDEMISPLAAAAAMLVAWRDQEGLERDSVLQGEAHWSGLTAHLTTGSPDDTFLQAFGLEPVDLTGLTAETLSALLKSRGPIMAVERSEAPAVMVISGLAVTDDGATLKMLEPSSDIQEPLTKPLADLEERLTTALIITLLPPEKPSDANRGTTDAESPAKDSV